MNNNFFLYNFHFHEHYAWTEELYYNLRDSFVEFQVLLPVEGHSYKMHIQTALVDLDGSKMRISCNFLTYFKYCYNPHARGAYDMRPLMNQLDGNLVYKGHKFSVMKTERASGELTFDMEKNEVRYHGCIKPNGIMMHLRADFTCINEVWTIGEFTRIENS